MGLPNSQFLYDLNETLKLYDKWEKDTQAKEVADGAPQPEGYPFTITRFHWWLNKKVQGLL